MSPGASPASRNGLLLAVLALGVAAAGVADAEPQAKARTPRPLPPKVAAAARVLFDEAAAADAKGDLDAAIAAYRKAYAIAPHADVQFNLADALSRDGNVRGAAAAFTTYLELAPDAPDAAEVRATIEALRATPGTLEIGAKTPGTVIYIDGVRRGVVPVTVQVPDGERRIDAITAISYRTMRHRADWARRHRFHVSPPPRVDGNVIVSGHASLTKAKVHVDGAEAGKLGSRLDLTSGKRTVEVVYGTCRWKQAVVAPAAASEVVVYLYLDLDGAAPEHTPRPPRAGEPAVVCPRGRFRLAALDLD